MKNIFFALITIILLQMPINSYATYFTDIDNHWAREEIMESVENLIIDGYSDNAFKPNNSVTVAEYLKIIIGSAKFDLVKEGKNLWPDYYISTAKQKGLIFENEFVDVNKKLTRNEVARITARYINVNDVGGDVHGAPKKINLEDLNEEYETEIKKLINLGVINGYEDNTFRGENKVTRAESLVIAKRATNVRRKLISSRNYTEQEKLEYSNIKKEDSNELCYEIKDEKVYIYDYGRYSTLKNYEVSNQNINIKRVAQIINSLIDEDSYTEVLYAPDEKIISQLVMRRGESKRVTEKGGYDFSLTYYENKPYELKRISMQDILSSECYMKISLVKMWRDGSKLNKKEYIDEYKKEKLRKVLEIEFGKKYADQMLNYMIEKYEQKISGQTAEIMQVEQKIFGKYVINYYKQSDGSPTFYIAKNL